VTNDAATGSAAGPAIRARSLIRRFGSLEAIAGVDLDIAAGTTFGLLGPDGAGKSTLIRMLATVLVPSAGDAEIFGASVTRSPGRVSPRIGYMSQRFSMYPDLTVAENLAFFATIRGVAKSERQRRAADLLARMGLDEFADRRALTLSGGMKQKLMLAATLMHEPDVLLLDEPTTGVDPVSRREFWRVLSALRHVGKTVLVATPYMDEAERCQRLAFLDGGKITHRGTPSEIASAIPGVMCELSSSRPRDVLAVVSAVPGVRSAHLYGEVVRVLWSGRLDPVPALSQPLAAAGLTAAVRPAKVDLEAAFAFLAGDSS
jgi:ABC-2 type transport system ATP-binding protein